MHKKGAVLVVGGGIAGMQAALDLAETGFYVYLVEETPAIGGKMAQLDKTFPTNDCAICMISPKLVEVGRHPNIKIIVNAEVEGLKGEVGNFQIRVRQRPRYVREDRCIGCYRCIEACIYKEAKFENEFDMGLSKRKPIYIPYPQAVPLASIIDPRHCIYFLSGKCPKKCQEACPRGAIDFEQQETVHDLEVGALILAPGYDTFNADMEEEYGFGRYKNVVTSLQFERILSASGPYAGEIKRPGDGKHPQKIAFIQCVGSRDLKYLSYCSSVCCVYTAKEAMIAKEHHPELEVSVFYIDLRAFGKGFEAYLERAQKEYGVRYVRSMVSRLVELPSGELLLRYREDDSFREEEFDLVVLSVGLKPSAKGQKMATKLGLNVKEHGFAKTTRFQPLETREGVFIAGAFSGPKDIPETIIQASAASAAAGEVLARVRGRGTLWKEKKHPPEKEVSPKPRVGVFICHCGNNIASVVDVKALARYASRLPGVVHAEDLLYTCSQDGLGRIKEAIEEHKLNRLIVASCTPRTHEPLFQETCREVGLNPFLFEMVNIREQCSWVHTNEPKRANEKAKLLVRMGVGKACTLRPLSRQKIKVSSRALVIGGGLSGMSAALSLANSGHQTYLVEREEGLGGNLRKLQYTLEGENVQEFLQDLIYKLEKHPKIKVYKKAEIAEFSGFVGNFSTVISTPQGKERVEHGVVIVATGGQEYKPSEYLYGEDKRVITQLELEGLIHQRALPKSKQIVMIQCVGSRDEERPYCSRVCCAQAIKNALALIEEDPNRQIYVLYRDMRTYGFMEDCYRKARESGVIFIRYEENERPQVQKEDGNILVTVQDKCINEDISIRADLLVLSTGIVPDPENEELSLKLKVPLDTQGFFSEAHVKLRPVDFASSGIFVCGLGHSPGLIPEIITKAKAAAGRAMTVLSKEHLETGGIVALVEAEKCTSCLTCVRGCPYAAISINEEGIAEVNPAKCQGCGICAADCPAKAIQLQGFEDVQEISMLELIS